jgi:hypothetical protein
LVWDALKARLGELRWTAKINESELSITLVNGSIIEIRSADAYDRMRGYSVDFVVFDEFADHDPAVWTVVRPTLSDRQGHALMIGTPKGNANWARTIWDSALTTPDWARWSFDTLSGGRVSPEEVEAARRDMDERTFRQEYLATFEDAGTRVFYNFSEANITPWTDPTPRTIHIGMDFNVDNLSAVILADLGGGEWHQFSEILLRNASTHDMVREILNRYPLDRHRVLVYPDPAGSARKTAADVGVTDHIILRNAGFTVISPRSHNPVRDGINAVNSVICSAAGDRRYRLDPSCAHTRRSLEQLAYQPGTMQPDKSSGLDHMADALRYVIENVAPISPRPTPVPVQMWAHR